MGSLATCLRRLSKVIRPEDAADIQAAYDALVNDNVPPDEAAEHAVLAQIAQARAERDQIVGYAVDEAAGYGDPTADQYNNILDLTDADLDDVVEEWRTARAVMNDPAPHRPKLIEATATIERHEQDYGIVHDQFTSEEDVRRYLDQEFEASPEAGTGAVSAAQAGQESRDDERGGREPGPAEDADLEAAFPEEPAVTAEEDGGRDRAGEDGPGAEVTVPEAVKPRRSGGALFSFSPTKAKRAPRRRANRDFLTIDPDVRIQHVASERERVTGRKVSAKVRDYAERLEEARGDPALFDPVMAEVEADKSLGRRDTQELAHLSGLPPDGNVTRAKALAFIQQRHDALVKGLQERRIQQALAAEGVELASFAAAGQEQKRAFDQLGFYSLALEAAKSWPTLKEKRAAIAAAEKLPPGKERDAAVKAAKQLPMDSGTPEQMLAQLKKAGVKDAEIRATKLDEFLGLEIGSQAATAKRPSADVEAATTSPSEGRTAGPLAPTEPRPKRTVTKSSIVKHLEENRVEVREAVYEARPPEEEIGHRDRQSFAKWSRYSLDPTNPTYRESVLYLGGGKALEDVRALQDRYRAAREAGREDEATQLGRELDAARESAYFTDSHFPDEPNPVVNLGTSIQKTADGKSVGLLDRFQMQWAQNIRDSIRNAYAKEMFGPESVDGKARIEELQKQSKAAVAKREIQDEAIRKFAQKHARVDYGRYSDAMARLETDNQNPEIRALAKEMNKKWEAAVVEEQRLQTELRAAMGQASFANLSKDQKSTISKSIDKDRKAGKLKGGVRDEAKIAELEKRSREATQALDDLLNEAVRLSFTRLNEAGRKQFGKPPPSWRSLPVMPSELLKDIQKPNGSQYVVPTDLATINAASELSGRIREARSAGDLAAAELNTAKASTPGHPLVNTTDQAMVPAIGRVIRQFVEAGVDYIAISPAEVLIARGEGSNNPAGMKAFQNEMLPRALLKRLQEYDPSIKQESKPLNSSMDGRVFVPKWARGRADDYIRTFGESERALAQARKDRQELANAPDTATTEAKIAALDETIAALEAQSAGKRPAPIQFHVFPLTDKVKQQVLMEGQALFSFAPARSQRSLEEREAAARAVMETPAWQAAAAPSADPTWTKASASPKWKAARRYVGSDGRPLAGFDAAVNFLTSRAIAQVPGGFPAREKKAYIIIGYPGAGKSTIADALRDNFLAVHVSADEAKEVIPEYEAGRNTSRVHLESTKLAEAMAYKLAETGSNFIIETLGTKDVIESRAREMRERGYTVSLVHADTGKAIAMERAVARYQREVAARGYGRAVPAEIYDKLKAADVYATGKASGVIDETAQVIWDEGAQAFRLSEASPGLEAIRTDVERPVEAGSLRVARADGARNDQRGVGQDPLGPEQLDRNGFPKGSGNTSLFAFQRPFTPAFTEARLEVAARVEVELRRALPAPVGVIVVDRLFNERGMAANEIVSEPILSASLGLGHKWMLRVAIGDKATMRAAGQHGVVHVLKELGLWTQAEWRFLVERANKVGIKEEMQRDKGYTLPNRKEGSRWEAYVALYASTGRQADLLDQELVGHLAEKWSAGDVKYGSRVDQLLDRIAQFFDAIRRALNSVGITALDQIFEPATRRAETAGEQAEATRTAEIFGRAFSGAIAHGDQAGRVEPFFASELSPQALALVSDEGQALMREGLMAIKAYHGSPHDFDAFDMSKVGTGEGVQAFGRGLYFAGSATVAKEYQRKLSPKNEIEAMAHAYAERELGLNWSDVNAYDRISIMEEVQTNPQKYNRVIGGRLYEVSLNVEDDELLDWNKKLADQPQSVRDAITKVWPKRVHDHDPTMLTRLLKWHTGREAFAQLHGTISHARSDEAVKALLGAGIKGIRYRDAGSRPPFDLGRFVWHDGNTNKWGIEEKYVQRFRLPDIQYTTAAEAEAVLQKAFDDLATYNYVIFSDKDVKIVAKDGKPVSAEERADILDQTQQRPDGSQSLAAFAPSPDLDMSPQARKARAEAMGFDTSRVVYHGARSDFGGQRRRSVTYVATTPERASIYAHSSGPDLLEGGGASPSGYAGGRVYPLYIRGHYFDWRNSGDVTKLKAAAARGELSPEAPGLISRLIESLRFDGRYQSKKRANADRVRREDLPKATPKSIMMWLALNDRDPDIVAWMKRNGYDGFTGREDNVNQFAVFDPSNIRSVHAVFDPAQEGSPQLLAAFAPSPDLSPFTLNGYQGEVETREKRDGNLLKTYRVYLDSLGRATEAQAVPAERPSAPEEAAATSLEEGRTSAPATATVSRPKLSLIVSEQPDGAWVAAGVVKRGPQSQNARMMVYRDSIGIPQPTLQLSTTHVPSYKAFSQEKGEFVTPEETYYTLNHAIEGLPHKKYASVDEAINDALQWGFEIVARDVDGYGMPQVAFVHHRTQAFIEQSSSAAKEKWKNASPVFVRYGKPPPTGKSRDFRDSRDLSGIAVFKGQMLPNGEVRVLPETEEQFAEMLSVRDRPLYVLSGDVIGTGSIGEPLLARVKVVRRAKTTTIEEPEASAFNRGSLSLEATGSTSADGRTVAPLAPNISRPPKDLINNLFAQVESDLGVPLSPDGILTEQSYQSWKARDPSRVEGHTRDANGLWVSPRARELMEVVQGGPELASFKEPPPSSGLDMSPEARKARAEAMGFDTSRVLYRGSVKDSTGRARYQYYTDRPEVADYFATGQTGRMQEGSRITPVWAKFGKSLVIPGDGSGDVNVTAASDLLDYPFDLGSPDIMEEIADVARDEGYELIEFRDVVDEGLDGPQRSTQYIPLQPNAVRSVNAVFDPARESFPVLLASAIPTYRNVIPIESIPLDQDPPKSGVIRAYHGTTRAFDKFKQGVALGPHFGTPDQAGSMIERGFSASQPGSVAPRGGRLFEAIVGTRGSPVPGGRMMPVEIDVRGSIIMKDGTAWTNRALRQAIRDNGIELTPEELEGDLRQALLDRGIDAIWYKNEQEGRFTAGQDTTGWSLIALRVEGQIKSATSGQNLYSAIPSPRLSKPEQDSLAQAMSEAVEIIGRVAGGVKVEFRNTIAAQEALSAEERAELERLGVGSQTGTLGGFYRPGTINAAPLIALATKDAEYDLRTTAGHEAWHHVELAMATPQELKLLQSRSEMDRLRRKYVAPEMDLAPGDPQIAMLPAFMSDVEARAIAFGRYRRMREEGMQPSDMHIGIRRFFDRVIRIFQSVRNLLAGRGYDSFEAVFERARTGEYGSDRGSANDAAALEAAGFTTPAFHGGLAAHAGKVRTPFWMGMTHQHAKAYAPFDVLGRGDVPEGVVTEFRVNTNRYFRVKEGSLVDRYAEADARHTLFKWARRLGYKGVVFEADNEIVALDPATVRSVNAGAANQTEPLASAIPTGSPPPTPPPGSPPSGGSAQFRQSLMSRLIPSAPLDRIMRIPFDIFGGVDAQNRWVPGLYLNEKAGHLITKAAFSDGGRFAWINPVLHKARAGLVDRYGLDPAYVARDRQRGLDEARIMAAVPELMNTLKDANIGSAEAQVLHAILTGERVPDREWAKVSNPIRNAIDQLGQDAVALGILGVEDYERNKGSYLHRVYRKHEVDQSGLARMVNQIMGKHRKKLLGEQFKGRGLWIEVSEGTLLKNLLDSGLADKGDKFVVLDKARTETDKVRERVFVRAGEPIPPQYAAPELAAEAQSLLVEAAQAIRAWRTEGLTAGQAKSDNRVFGRPQVNQATYAATHTRASTAWNALVAKVGKDKAKHLVGDLLGDPGVDLGDSELRQKPEAFGASTAEVPSDRMADYVKAHYSTSGYINRGSFEVRGKKGGRMILWRDWTKAERERMGEITDARYTIAKTYMLMAHDLAVGRFYKDISENQDWASKTEPSEKWAEAADYRYRVAVDETVEWVKVPEMLIPKSNTKRYGALAGLWVRAEIWRDLSEIERMQTSHFWNALLTQWKLMKTARSPVVHMNNVMSNAFLMDSADVRARDLIAGVRSLAKGDAQWQEAAAYGAFGADMVAQEIRRDILQPILEEIEKAALQGQGPMQSNIGVLGKVLDAIWSKAKWADRKMVKLYQIEDEVFRMATYIRRRSQGAAPQQAADEAREQFIDYDIRAPWVNIARRSVLPFISYSYRAVPMVAKTVMLRPWKLAKYFTVVYALNAMAYALAPSEDDEDRERRSLRENEQGYTWIGAPRMLRMPYTDQYGHPVFLDIRRWIPAGDVFDVNQGQSGLPIPAPLQLGGPVMMGFELALNKQAFTGKEIVNNRADDWWDKTSKIGDWAWKSWMPSAAWIPGSWYWTKIENAAYGVRERGTDRPYSLPQAVLSSVGVKLKPQDVDEGMRRWGRDFNRVEKDLKSELRLMQKDKARGALSEKAFERQREHVLHKLKTLRKRRQKIMLGASAEALSEE